MPESTVLMSVYNGASYLRDAIESILIQTYRDFEFVVIDDASTDDTCRIVESFSDPRLILMRNVAQLGLARSLNRGIDVARGRYIVRMDADDISVPNRIAKQIRFMEEHSDVGVCGSWMSLIGECGGYRVAMPTDDASIRSYLLFNTYLAHPSVVIRKHIFDGGLRYDETFDRAQDYELWTRAAEVTRFANYPEHLLLYRTYAHGQRKEHELLQADSNTRVHKRLLRRLGIDPTPREISLHLAIGRSTNLLTRECIATSLRWFEILKEANDAKAVYDAESFAAMLNRQWYRVCAAGAPVGRSTWKAYASAPLALHSQIRWWDRAVLRLQCILRLSRAHPILHLLRRVRLLAFSLRSY